MVAVAFMVGAFVIGSVATVSAADPPEYLPPNPPAVSVPIGEMGWFPLPGLQLSDPSEIIANCDVEFGDPVVSPPKADSDPNDGMEMGVKNSAEPQIATCSIVLASPTTTVLYTLVLYYGLPLPERGPIPSTGRDMSLPASLAALLVAAGGGLLVLSRRKTRTLY